MPPPVSRILSKDIFVCSPYYASGAQSYRWFLLFFFPELLSLFFHCSNSLIHHIQRLSHLGWVIMNAQKHQASLAHHAASKSIWQHIVSVVLEFAATACIQWVVEIHAGLLFVWLWCCIKVIQFEIYCSWPRYSFTDTNQYVIENKD